MEAAPVLPRLAFQEYVYLKEVQPRVHAYALRLAMNRVRAYHAASLGPMGGRNALQETLLVGHVHVDEAGIATLVEGFNGAEGQKWADRALAELKKAALATELTAFRPTTALHACGAARNPR